MVPVEQLGFIRLTRTESEGLLADEGHCHRFGRRIGHPDLNPAELRLRRELVEQFLARIAHSCRLGDALTKQDVQSGSKSGARPSFGRDMSEPGLPRPDSGG